MNSEQFVAIYTSNWMNEIWTEWNAYTYIRWISGGWRFQTMHMIHKTIFWLLNIYSYRKVKHSIDFDRMNGGCYTLRYACVLLKASWVFFFVYSHASWSISDELILAIVTLTTFYDDSAFFSYIWSTSSITNSNELKNCLRNKKSYSIPQKWQNIVVWGSRIRIPIPMIWISHGDLL